MRKIGNWLRDDSRDELARALNAFGVGATMGERGRPEEAFKRRGDSLGLIDITQSPVKWINVVRHIQGGHSSNVTYWCVFGIPSEGDFSPGQGGRLEDLRLQAQRVELTSVRRRRFPIFGSVERMEWKGYDGGSGLISALSMVQNVEAFCQRRGDLHIQLHHGAFQGWTVEMKRTRLSYQDWLTVEAIARLLLSSG